MEGLAGATGYTYGVYMAGQPPYGSGGGTGAPKGTPVGGQGVGGGSRELRRTCGEGRTVTVGGQGSRDQTIAGKKSL